MEFKAHSEIVQTQQLKMTPEFLQAISILALPSLALADIVAAEVEANPFLRWADPKSVPVSSFLESSYGSVSANRTHSYSYRLLNVKGFPSIQRSGAENTFSADDGFISGNTALREHLVTQLDQATADADIRVIGRILIDALDPAGYLIEPLDVLQDELGCSEKEILSGLKLIHDLEPTGVGARSLRECLLLQLHDRDQADAATLAVLEHLDLVAKRDWEGLRKATHLKQEDIIRCIRIIASLDPKPGLAFLEMVDSIQEPDAFVRVKNDGSLLIELNEKLLPRVLVDRDYQKRLTCSVKSDTEKSFVQKCVSRARWLSYTLECRAETLLRVLQAIAQRQTSFFTNGWGNLGPLILKDISEDLNLHESTISRVVANKTILTPLGIYALKDFFSVAVPVSNGIEPLSAKAVSFRIKQILTDENNRQIFLSDEKIVRMLKEEGISIARRTVAKYRKQLKLPSSIRQRQLARFL